MTPLNGSKYRAIVDTHRHPVGAKLRDKMAEACLFDPKKPLPQANAQDLVASWDFLDLDAMMANAHALTGTHERRFEPTAGGVHVVTTESFSGDPVAADPPAMQASPKTTIFKRRRQ